MAETDFLEEKRQEIRARIEELEPLVEQYRRLKAAEQALAGVASRRLDTPEPRGRRRRGSGEGGSKPGRRRGSGTRAAEALSLVEARPGITISELAQEMGIQANYLYRVMPGLAEEGKVVRSGKGWHPAS